MDDSKFIPAYASDHVSLRCRPREPAACNFEALVPGLMPESIIYRLKTVEIRQEQSATRPWVVWIGAQPRGGDRRR